MKEEVYGKLFNFVEGSWNYLSTGKENINKIIHYVVLRKYA